MFPFVSRQPQPIQVASNIVNYVATATFPELQLHPTTPPMPIPMHKSHRNMLTVRIERNHLLTQTQRIRSSSFDASVIECKSGLDLEPMQLV